MKHLLMVIDSLLIGGAERITLTLAELFVKEGITVDIVTVYDYAGYEIPKGVRLHTIGYKKRWFQNYLYTKRLQEKILELEAIQQSPYDLILVHLLKSARLMQGFKHKHLYFILHSTMSQESLSTLSGAKKERKLKRLHRKFDHKNIITVSKGIAIDLVEVVGIKPKTLQVIYNPIDIQKIISMAQEENPYVDEKPYIVHLGRLVQLKRHDRLLEAYKASKIEAKLVLIGEGIYRKEIEKKIKILELQDSVILAGMRTNPYPIIKDAKLLVLSSDYEGLSMAILEALTLGVPVVSTDCPSGPREILDGFMDNALVALDDIPALAEMMKKQYEQHRGVDPKVLERFESKNVVKQYLALMK